MDSYIDSDSNRKRKVDILQKAEIFFQPWIKYRSLWFGNQEWIFKHIYFLVKFQCHRLPDLNAYNLPEQPASGWGKPACTRPPITGHPLREDRQSEPRCGEVLTCPYPGVLSWLYFKCPQRKSFPFKFIYILYLRLLGICFCQKSCWERKRKSKLFWDLKFPTVWAGTQTQQWEDPGLEWMRCFQHGPKWHTTFLGSRTPPSSLLKPSLDSSPFTVACFTFKALH